MSLPIWLRAEQSGIRGILIDTLLPPHCVACGAAGAWFCAACIAGIPGGGRLSAVSRLPAHDDALSGAWALSPHVYPLREAVHGLKYGGLRVLGDPLSMLLAHGWQGVGREADLVVPVPLHRAQLRRRGYNQSDLLALGLSEQARLDLRRDILQRRRATRSQVGLSPDERLQNVSGAFACAEGPVRGARVLLIDDVLTTGATMSACARALSEAGALEVWGLALTHAPAPGSWDRSAPL